MTRRRLEVVEIREKNTQRGLESRKLRKIYDENKEVQTKVAESKQENEREVRSLEEQSARVHQNGRTTNGLSGRWIKSSGVET